MIKEIVINSESFLKSGLSLADYVVCWLLHKKEIDLLNRVISPFFENDLYEDLEYRGYIKMNGDKLQDYEVRQKFLNVLKLSESDAKIADVVLWIKDYRDIFKGKKPGGMGDPSQTTAKMKKFLEAYPEYTKDDIMKAAKHHVDSTAPSYQYMMYADYFIFKEDPQGGIKSRLLSTLEELKEGGFVINKDLTREL